MDENQMSESMETSQLEVGEDIQNIFKILPEGIEAGWPSKNDFFKYVQKLGSLDLQQLQKEKIKLTEESSDIANQTQELAIQNYKKFIETAENTRNIYKQFELTETHLNQLIEKLPEFDSQCTRFTNESDDIRSHRQSSTLMFNKTQQLTEILELPELMENSIADGNYEDALEIVDFIRRLQHKYPEIKIFSVLLADVEKLWLIIIQKLLAQLRSDIQLPKCLQAVGYLRCMNIFTEAELRLKFLQCRDTWLQSLLDEIPKDKPSQHLIKTIELSRIHLFQIITQYNAIFCDDAQPTGLKNDIHINEAAIFQSWVQEKISQFLKTMQYDLTNSEATSFSSTLSQCMYFGLSFSKVGCDFRGLAAPIITKCLQTHFENNIKSVTAKFKNDMDSFTLINKVYATSKQLQDFYPLAVYCNGLLQSFNDLRVCAPLQLCCFVTKIVQRSLQQIAEIILQFYQQEHQAFSEVANEQFASFCKCFVYELIPHVQSCLKSVYPPVQVATHLGVTVQFLEKGKYLSFDRDLILGCIKHLLPLSIDTVIGASEESVEVNPASESIPLSS